MAVTQDPAEILQSCLSRIESGEDPRAVLAEYPAQRAEIEPLLGIGLAVRRNRARPRPQFRAELQAKLVAAEPSGSRFRVPAWLVLPRTWVARTAGATLGAVLVLGSVGVAAAGARPGDVLYPLRAGVEQFARAARAILPAEVVERSTATPTPALLSALPQPIVRLTEVVPMPLDGAADVSAPETRASSEAVSATSQVTRVSTAAATPRPSATPTMVLAAAVDATTPLAGDPTTVPTVTPLPPDTGNDAGSGDDRDDDDPPPTAQATATSTDMPPPPRGGVVEGKVRSAEGDGVPDVVIVLHPFDRGAPPGGRELRTGTGRGGHYRIEGVPPGAYLVEARIPRRGGEMSMWFPGVRLRAEATRILVRPNEVTGDVDFRLPRPDGREGEGPVPPAPPSVIEPIPPSPPIEFEPVPPTERG